MTEIVDFSYSLQLEIEGKQRGNSPDEDEKLRMELHKACDLACERVIKRFFGVNPAVMELNV